VHLGKPVPAASAFALTVLHQLEDFRQRHLQRKKSVERADGRGLFVAAGHRVWSLMR
jgi:hypothetical protein